MTHLVKGKDCVSENISLFGLYSNESIYMLETEAKSSTLPTWL